MSTNRAVFCRKRLPEHSKQAYIFDAMTTQGEPNLEIEIKLQLASFMDYLKLIGSLSPLDGERHHVNSFYDSEDRLLSRGGWALRVRAESDRGFVTLKSIDAPLGTATVRREIEAEIGPAAAHRILLLQEEVLDLDVAPVKFIQEHFPKIRLAKLIQFENVRSLKNYQIGDYQYLFEIDKTSFSDGSVDYELEVELESQDRVVFVENALRRLFSTLAIPFEKQMESKFARALKRARMV